MLELSVCCIFNFYSSLYEMCSIELLCITYLLPSKHLDPPLSLFPPLLLPFLLAAFVRAHHWDHYIDIHHRPHTGPQRSVESAQHGPRSARTNTLPVSLLLPANPFKHPPLGSVAHHHKVSPPSATYRGLATVSILCYVSEKCSCPFYYFYFLCCTV
jgi:hypothetical protein